MSFHVKMRKKKETENGKLHKNHNNLCIQNQRLLGGVITPVDAGVSAMRSSLLSHHYCGDLNIFVGFSL